MIQSSRRLHWDCTQRPHHRFIDGSKKTSLLTLKNLYNLPCHTTVKCCHSGNQPWTSSPHPSRIRQTTCHNGDFFCCNLAQGMRLKPSPSLMNLSARLSFTDCVKCFLEYPGAFSAVVITYPSTDRRVKQPLKLIKPGGY